MNNLLSSLILLVIPRNLCKFATCVGWLAFDASFQYELQNYLFWKQLNLVLYIS
jgi:hypothetical protein